jgi:hypothetical protein
VQPAAKLLQQHNLSKRSMLLNVQSHSSVTDRNMCVQALPVTL